LNPFATARLSNDDLSCSRLYEREHEIKPLRKAKQ